MPIVFKIAMPVPMYRVFDYLPPSGVDPIIIRPGVRIEVPFGRSRKIGILLDVSATSELDPARLREALAILDQAPLLSAADIRLISWSSHYYHHPIGEALASAMSAVLKQAEASNPKMNRRIFSLPRPADTGVPQVISRAPRQAELLLRLDRTPEGLAMNESGSEATGFAAAARELVKKGLANWRDGAADPPSPNPHQIPAATGNLILNTFQDNAVKTISASFGAYRAFLLEGITGSGKTEVYLRLTQEALARHQQVMILLPEINLTPQLEERFRSRFAAPIVVFHSSLSAGERRRAWLSMQRGESAIILGTRSAVFIPAPTLGLIVLDEEHDSSFKQQEGFRFSARDVAIMRASYAGVPILLGSATPSLESLHNVYNNRYRLIQLPCRAGEATEPGYLVLDIRAQRLNEGISAQLAGQMAAALSRGEQILLFINRRGFAPTLICHDCGWVATCRDCDARMVIHAADSRLQCHHCGLEQRIPTACPSCRKTALQALGLGTERVEAALKDLFPSARIARIDRDTTRRKGSLERLLKDVHAAKYDVLIGTQMLAKGHHFPGVTLAGILDVDSGLYSTDFRATERTAQLITQVAGRAGRGQKAGTVILQTRHPDHPLLEVLIRKGYAEFARACLKEREAAGMPPYSYQVLWRAESHESAMAQNFLAGLAMQVQPKIDGTVQVLGPVPAPLPRRSKRYRWQLLLQSERRGVLHELVDHMISQVQDQGVSRKLRWSVDVDPVDLY